MCDQCGEKKAFISSLVDHDVPTSSTQNVSEACCFPFVCHISVSLHLRAEGAMRTMTVEKLLKGMPTLQSQIDALLDFDVSDTGF